MTADQGVRWWNLANCADTTNDTRQPWDFPETRGNTAYVHGRVAWLKKTYCDPCPVRRQCLTDALTHRTYNTVRGGRHFTDRGTARVDRGCPCGATIPARTPGGYTSTATLCPECRARPGATAGHTKRAGAA